ncbi:MAG: MFS transporter [Deltaproteobacteria bacterium]|jgi:proton-dependent oligopeptide transporter, POT family|nr:MFS transporter [Deltaproteobacteria bacterium]
MDNGKQSVFKQFPGTFWIGNCMEIFERMSWYGFFALSSLYITGSVASGGLGFSSEDRGLLQGVVTFFIYLFPFFTGALGDRYGFKKMLLIAYCVLSPAYYLLGQMKSFPAFFGAFFLVGIGAAIFKPLIVGTIGKTTTKKTGSLGFGIFYMMVNIGGFAGPFIAAAIRNTGWNYVFIASSIWIALNIPILLLFYKEPTHESTSDTKRSFKQVMVDMMEVLGNGRFFVTIFVVLFIFVLGSKWLSVGEVFTYAGIWIGLNLLVDFLLRLSGAKSGWMKVGNTRFLVFLLLLSSFWVAFNQIFITLPEYIRDFSNTAPLMSQFADWLSRIGFSQGAVDTVRSILATSDGKIKPEQIVNINALAIIFFQIIVSFFLTRLKALVAIMLGIGVSAISFVMLAFGVNPLFVILGVFIFSFGEMMASPKAKEYTAHAVAPPDKVGLYMGYYMWCNALGNLFGGILSGRLYGWLARDLGRPDIMWFIFAGLSVFCAFLLFIYHKTVGVKIERESEAHA